MITLIEPRLRFNKTVSEYRKDRFNPDSEPVYPLDYDFPFEYTCPICDYKVSFKNEDLQKHANSNHSNLSDADKINMDNFVITNHLDSLSFIDFNCPKCLHPVRILYDCGAGGFFGMIYRIQNVIEIKK